MVGFIPNRCAPICFYTIRLYKNNTIENYINSLKFSESIFDYQYLGKIP